MRDLDIPELNSDALKDQDESLYHLYGYWTPSRSWSVAGDIVHEDIETNREITPQGVRNSSASISFRHSSPIGLFTELGTTFVKQDVDRPPDDEDDFFVVDAAVGYRFPKRMGIFSFEVQNLTDETFFFQDLNHLQSQPSDSPRLAPERIIIGKFTLDI